jgi:alginate O-acetyltransferase complex protein AlgI
MPFLSFNFAIFLGLSLLIFYLAPSRWRPGLLLGLSYIFYLTWSAVYTLLLVAVTVGVYGTARWIESRRTEQGKRAWMALGVMTLLILLFAFKSGA